MSAFVRYRSPIPNARGAKVGIFALTNGLVADGALTHDEIAWVRVNNAWFDAAYDDPTKHVPQIFDRSVNPITECWFKSSATDLIARVDGYLQLLDARGVSWELVESDDPGPIVYEDDVQVVVALDAAR